MIKVHIRHASGDDAAGINAVYNPFIVESAVTFETTEHTASDRRSWIIDRDSAGAHPVFVAEKADGGICGFANAAPFDPRGAYATSVKTSVFVDPACHGAGVAKKLYAALFEALAGADVHRAYALIVAPNPASAALHKTFGFNHVATLDEVVRKFDRYYDVMWFEKRL
jgi:phosphinothricin acetyltransferase